jgi:hypothetical protein
LCSYERSYEYSYERKLGCPGEIDKAAHPEGLPSAQPASSRLMGMTIAVTRKHGKVNARSATTALI